MPIKLKLGSRQSKLALAQASIVAQKLTEATPGIEIEIVEIRTSGDKLATASLAQVGGKGLFIKELEQALADGSIDMAIHSMKDLPAVIPEQFKIASVPQRENTADVLVTREGIALTALKAGTRLGTSSQRRRFQALRINRSLEIVALRGNVDTRLKRVAEGELDAIIVAMAGLKRLGRTGEVRFVELSGSDFIPAAAQGALAIETLADRRVGVPSELDRALPAINDSRAFYETAAERTFLAGIGASCFTPVGVRAVVAGRNLSVTAILFSADGARELSESIEEPVDADLAASVAAHAGERLAEKILARGGAELLGDE